MTTELLPRGWKHSEDHFHIKGLEKKHSYKTNHSTEKLYDNKLRNYVEMDQTVSTNHIFLINNVSNWFCLMSVQNHAAKACKVI